MDWAQRRVLLRCKVRPVSPNKCYPLLMSSCICCLVREIVKGNILCKLCISTAIPFICPSDARSTVFWRALRRCHTRHDWICFVARPSSSLIRHQSEFNVATKSANLATLKPDNKRTTKNFVILFFDSKWEKQDLQIYIKKWFLKFSLHKAFNLQ